MNKLLIAWTTLANEAVARELAAGVIANKLAACVQVEGPVSSYYRWEGKVENESEWRLMIKFPDTKAEALKSWLLEVHPYDTPQWVVVKAEEVSDAYASWVRDVSDSA